jgi:two-component system response regulator FixJ
VYVVDDDPTVRRSTAFLLGLNAMECRAFATGEELLAALNALDPGCVLLDIMLPGKSGLEVQAELARRGSALPVVAMTGGHNPDAAEESLGLGAIAFLQKPFPEEALLEALERGFDRLRRRGERPKRRSQSR